MENVLVLSHKLIAIYLMVIIGFFVSKNKAIGEYANDTISLILNKVALPMLILATYARISLTKETIINAGIVICAALLVYLLNYGTARFFGKIFKFEEDRKVVLINGMVHANTAFLAFPLLFQVFGEEGLFYGTMFYLADNLLLFSIGIKRLKPKDGTKNKLAPVTIALLFSIVMMIVCNLIGFDMSTTVFYDAANDIGATTTPLAFIFLGMIIQQSNLKEIFMNKVVMFLMVIKMIIIPFIIIMLLYFSNLNLSVLIMLTIVIQSLMPPYSSLLAMAYEYKRDIELATSLVVLGHIFALITIPVLFLYANFLFK
ncbi:MAG: AEC family transporter [Erysipelotrichales bacterium]